ncbi:MAG: efflux RND transporter periplasmic adaptor subunit [Myxococcales bacterium]|nr:efflux RND transporter periplasmic adaptor subunit [Myxococcales bacterium]
MTAARFLVTMWLLGLGIGCNAESPAPGVSGPVVAKAAAEPDMCAEHGVLEALCTKCHPKLIPVFEAKGDWCAEHGFPESICPTCSPDAKGRPKLDVSAPDGAPPDGVLVNLADPGAAERAGLATAEAVARVLPDTIVAPVELSFDATRIAEVRGPRAGIVDELSVDLGSVVSKGTTLLTLSSPELTFERSKLAGARVLVSAHAAELRRQQHLLKEQLITRESVASARAAWLGAKAEADALEAGLDALGAAAGAFTVVAPIAGEIQTRDVVKGSAVTPEDRLFTIVDTGVVWAELAVDERELGRLAKGQPVEVRLDALPAQSFEGEITWISPSIDAHSRTATVRVPLKNPSGALRAGMYGSAKVTVSPSTSRVFVPSRAVQRAKSATLVFVPEGTMTYVGERVSLGMTVGDDVEITAGLVAGKRVVTDGAFFLKTETLKDSIGAGCCAGED